MSTQPLEVEPLAVDVSLRRRLLNYHTVLSFAVAIGVLITLPVWLKIDLQATWQELKRANLLLFATAFVVYYLSFPLRGARWGLLLRNAGVGREQSQPLPSTAGLTEIVMISWFANCILPAKLGDLYRAYLLRKGSGVSFARTAGTILAERVTDLAILFALLALSALTLAGSRSGGPIVRILQAGAVMMLVLAVGLLGLRHVGPRLVRFLPLRWTGIYQRLQEGTFDSFRRMRWLVTATVAVWLLEIGRLFFVTYSLDLHLALGLILFVALANSLLTALPLTPGGLGLVESGVIGLLLLGSVTKEQAVAVAVLDRIISYWSVIGIGLVVFVLSRRK